MNKMVQDILKKINYIEADLEIHKQILFSTPSSDTEELERIVAEIASKKEQINALRLKIQEISPEEYNNILVLENAVTAFREIAGKRELKFIKEKKIDEDCLLALKNNTQIPCLVKACDKDGEWIIITIKGEIKQYSQTEVEEKIEESAGLTH